MLLGGWAEDECFEVVGKRVAKRPGRGRNSRARRVRWV
jgi:hypothetical protein